MSSLLAPLLNRLLADQPGAAERLTGHAGKVLRLDMPLARIDLVIGPDGRFSAIDRPEPPDCEITLPLHVLLQLPLRGGEALNEVGVSGDGVLASDVSALLRQLDWVPVLQPYLGPVLAARADQAAHAFTGWRDEAREAVARSLAEYLVYEAGVLAEGAAVRGFVAQVDELRDAAARLEARLAILEGRRAEH